MEIFDSQHTDELATLLALADQGSFAAAGRLLARHPSVLSKRMQALERRLGVRWWSAPRASCISPAKAWRLGRKLRQAAI
jgi:DNA-binding transcriptional LysR family regulator